MTNINDNDINIIKSNTNNTNNDTKGDKMKKQYITAKELAEVMEISTANAYVRIRTMNEELAKEGYITVQGKVPIAFAEKKLYGINFEEVKGEE